jgi:hypothetical protein
LEHNSSHRKRWALEPLAETLVRNERLADYFDCDLTAELRVAPSIRMPFSQNIHAACA